MLHTVFEELEENLVIDEVALISTDGLLMAGSIKSNIHLDVFCAMIALMTHTANKAGAELQKGKLDKLFLDYKHGIIVASEVTSTSIIAVMTSEKENIGLIFNRIDKASEKIKIILE